MRDFCGQIRAAKEHEAIKELCDSFASIVEELENVIRPLNTQVICELPTD